MSRTLTPAQSAAVNLPSTRPVYVCRLAHSGADEWLSASGPVVFDGIVCTPGGFDLDDIQDAISATITLPWSPERVQEIQSGTWRGQDCVIYAIPGTPGDSGEYTEDDAIEVLSGTIRTSSFSGDRIRVQAVQESEVSQISPRHTFESVCSFIPAAGSVIDWEGDIVTLESSR